MLGRWLLALLPGLDRAQVVRDITADLMAGRDVSADDQLFEGPDGEPRYFDIRVSRMGNDQFTITWSDVTSRHLAAREVEVAREYYKLLAENAAEVVIRSSLPGTLEWVSPSVTKALGWHPEQIQGMPLPQLIHPDDRPGVLCMAAESSAAPGTVHHTEARVLDASGGHRWMSITMKIAIDAAGDPLARICTWRDIESEVEVRRTLREEIDSHEAINNSATDALISVAKSGRIVAWNAAAATMFGYQAEEALGHPFGLVVPGNLTELALRWLSAPTSPEVLEAATRTYRLRLTRRDGSEFPADVSVAIWERAGEQHISGIVRDVTEQQVILDDLEASRTELDEAQRLAGAGSWTYDLRTGACHRSPELCRIHNLPPAGEAATIGDLTVGMSDGGGALLDAVARVSATGETAELTYELRLGDDVARQVQGRIAGITDARGGVKRLRGTAVDVTEMHQAALARDRRVAAHADYLARVEHTLRTHLSVVEGWAGILESSFNQLDEPTRTGALGAIKRNAAALVGHVQSLMSESSQYAMAEAIVPEPVEVTRVAAAAAADYRGLSQRRIEFVCEAPVSALGSEAALDTVVRHLIENAVRHTPETGRVEVAARQVAGGVEVVVSDDGPGISDGVELFTPFVKGTGSAGHGLGLHVVRTLVEAMGGTVVGRNSETGPGAEFVVTLRGAPA